jgi:hypothetical protein
VLGLYYLLPGLLRLSNNIDIVFIGQFDEASVKDALLPLATTGLSASLLTFRKLGPHRIKEIGSKAK